MLLRVSDASHPRILLVDDDPVILRLLEVNFRIDGFEVDSASRGEEALEKAAANPPDAVVLDVMMPGLDGWEVCERLRANPSLAGIPVVFLSARVRDEDRTRGEALGIADYVSKPFDPTDLVELVRRHLAGERP
ncbi:MAG: response regulator [Actinobacteria bacterium]|nr:response regulator [Actinomycetota bacterium]